MKTELHKIIGITSLFLYYWNSFIFHTRASIDLLINNIISSTKVERNNLKFSIISWKEIRLVFLYDYFITSVNLMWFL